MNVLAPPQVYPSTTYGPALLCGLTCLGALFLNLQIGSQEFQLRELLSLSWEGWRVGSLNAADQQQLELLHRVFFAIRIPRLLVAALCGGALALAGAVCQGLFRNPLASADVLGTSSGASLASVLTFYYGGAFSSWYTLPLFAAGGGLITTGLLLAVLGRRPDLALEQLLLLGFAVSSLCGALSSFVLSLSLSHYDKATAMLHWLLGGFSGRGWEHLGLAIGPMLVAVPLAWGLARLLDVLALGDDIAETLGVRVRMVKYQALVVIALLVGATVAVAGALPFVGLMVPHVSRGLVGPQHRPLFLVSMVNGASLTLLADLLARTVRAPLEIEVGVFTALLGAPFFFWLLWRHYHGRP